MAAKRFSYSAFLRGPSTVLPAVELADIVLERRDGTDLVLSTVTRAAALQEGLHVGSAALRGIARLHPDLLAAALRTELAWVAWLPEADQVACMRELTDDLAASVGTESFVRFHNDLTAWRHTAEVWADPDLAACLAADFDGDVGVVPRPAACTGHPKATDGKVRRKR